MNNSSNNNKMNHLQGEIAKQDALLKKNSISLTYLSIRIDNLIKDSNKALTNSRERMRIFKSLR